MDERLKGRTILIGREPRQNQLAVSISGIGKVGMTGAVGSVPGCVSRWKDGTAHCQISIGQNGDMTLKNLKEANVTYVNGAAIISKRIDGNSNVELGKDHYAINVNMILQAASKLLPQVQQIVQTPAAAKPATPLPPPAKEYSIRHLEWIWNDYHNNTLRITKRRNKIGLLSRVPMLFTMGSGSLAAVASLQSWGSSIVVLTTALTVIGLVMFLYGLYMSYADKSIEELEQLKEGLEQHYVCPNPDCKRFMGVQSYNVIRKQKICPLCRCKYIDK